MNKICVIAKNKETYFINKLREILRKEFHIFDPWSDFDLPKADSYLVRTTGVYGSDLDLSMIKVLPQDKVFNPLNSLQLFRTKPKQYIWLENHDFKILPWLNLKEVDLLTVEKFFRLYPYGIVKPLTGQGGWGVEKVTWETFKSWKKKKGSDQSYLLQPYINDLQEYRYFFIKGSLPVILNRKRCALPAANFSSGGSAQLSELTFEVKVELERLVNLSGAHYGAIDFFLDHSTPVILELNSVPGFEQVETISKRSLVESLLESLKI